MLNIVNNKIQINRGDTGVITVNATNKDGSEYVFNVGDVVRLKVTEAGDCGSVVLQKDVVVDNTMTEVDIILESEDTRIGELINSPVHYWYEIELNPDTKPQTIIGYDQKGAKLFTLYPEGGPIE